MPSGPVAVTRRDVRQRPEVDSALRVALERDVNRFPEVAVLEAQLHRSIRLGFAGAAEQFDHVIRAELREVQILDLVGPVDLVERERLREATRSTVLPVLRFLTLAVSATSSVVSRGGTRNSWIDSRSSNSLKSGTSTDDGMPS